MQPKLKPKHLLELPPFLLITGLVCALPLRIVRAMGGGLGRLGYRVFTSRRRVTFDNLRHAFPDMPEAGLERIARASFRTVAQSFLELLWFPRLTARRLEREYRMTNADDVRAELGARGAVVLVSHFASWEFILQGIHRHFPGRTSVVFKPLSNPITNRWILRWRSKLGLKWIPMADAIAATREAVRRGELVLLAADQSVAVESIWVPFFGRDIPTAKGPGALALKEHVPLYLSVARRHPDGTCTGELVRVDTEDIGEYTEEHLLTLTRRFTAMTEDFIRRDPEQWMWTHKRWKHAGKQVEGRHSSPGGPGVPRGGP